MSSIRLANSLRSHVVRFTSIVVLTSALLPGAAFGADGDIAPSHEAGLKSTSEYPWATGVPVVNQDAAERLFHEGNALFALPDFIRAAQKYREALEQWDHPTIHYNLALALNNLDNPIEAHRHLEQALRYGGAPLDDKYQQEARQHLRATSRQISILEISCVEPDTTVTLDGKAISSPVRLLLPPGQHQVVAKKSGYISREYNLALFPGTPKRVNIRLYTESELMETHRAVPFWVPVTSAGVGAGMVTAGAILANRSNGLRQRYDNSVGESCKGASGCRIDSTRIDWRADADALRTWSTISYIAGAATITGGVIWMLLNKPQTRQYTPEERERQTRVVPVVSGNVLGAVAIGRF